MLRRTLLALGVAALLGLSIQMAGSAEAAPGNVTVTQGCSENAVGADVTIGWSGGSAAASQTVVDISLYNNAWAAGTYSSSTLTATQTSYRAVSLLSNTQYYLRISQLLAGGWDSSLTYMFMTGPACYGGPTASYSTPASGGGMGYGPGGGMGYGPGHAHSALYGMLSSFSLQPIDYFVQYARAAMYFPPNAPIYVNCYPPPFVAGCHFP